MLASNELGRGARIEAQLGRHNGARHRVSQGLGRDGERLESGARRGPESRGGGRRGGTGGSGTEAASHAAQQSRSATAAGAVPQAVQVLDLAEGQR